MKERKPRGVRREITDEQLRADLAVGMTPPEIAEKYGVSRQAVHYRVKRLQLTTVSATLAPGESQRYVGRQLDAFEQLNRSLGKVNLLLEACDRWLRDAEDPERYDIGARAEEVDITYVTHHETGERLVTVRHKEKLSVLLERLEDYHVEKTEWRHADPRELILKTAQEVRQTVQTAADLARMLADAQAMERFREALLAAIREVDPDVANQIAESVRRSILLCNAADAVVPVPA